MTVDYSSVNIESGFYLSLRAERSNLTDRRIISELAFWPWMALYICATGMARKCDAFGIPLQGFEPGNDRFYRQLLKIEELPSCEGSSE